MLKCNNYLNALKENRPTFQWDTIWPNCCWNFQSHHLIAFPAIFKEKMEPSVSRNAQPKAALQLPLHKCSNLLVTSVRLWWQHRAVEPWQQDVANTPTWSKICCQSQLTTSFVFIPASKPTFTICTQNSFFFFNLGTAQRKQAKLSKNFDYTPRSFIFTTEKEKK